MHLINCQETISYCTHAFPQTIPLLHTKIKNVLRCQNTSIILPDRDNKKYRIFALNYAVHIWNNTPRDDLEDLTPDERFSGVNLSKDTKQKKIRKFHPFGCPTYVLTDKLQGTSKPPRWAPRTRTGIFLGHSSEHATSVSLVLNPNTYRISPQ